MRVAGPARCCGNIRVGDCLCDGDGDCRHAAQRGCAMKEAGTASRLRQRVRRLLPVVIALLFLAWILFIVILISVNPTPGTGNPMD